MDKNIENVLNNGKSGGARSLVFCETLFQLFSTMTIFLKYDNHAPVDIVLTDDSDFSNAKAALEKSDLFENIYEYKIKGKITELWKEVAPEDRLEIAKKPGQYIDDIELEHSYTDLWVNLDTMAPKLFYYKLVDMGMTPVVHFVDEGTSSYVLNFSATHKDFINHRRLFGELAFPENLSDMWLCEPDVYCGEYTDIPLYKVPVEKLHDKAVVSFYKEVFGDGELPEEKFIFFEESFAAEGRTTNDLELFRAIVDVVGKDNIIVKRHPRNPIDRFSKLGYKVMDAQKVPWEMMIIDKELSDKVLISIGSSATLTPFYLYGMKPKAFLLKQLLIGRVHYLADFRMNMFFEKVLEVVNEKATNAYYPNSLNELKLALNSIIYGDCISRPDDDMDDVELEEHTDSHDGEFYLKNYSQTDVAEEDEISDSLDDDNDSSISLEEKKQIIEKAKAEIKTPYVSVVVPVYNTEKYLRRCLDSLVFQTLENIEIIVVNDGSPDNSQMIIDEYVEKFPNKIIPIIKENGGLSSARQCGAEHATGKYIGFVDSDDWVDYSYCESCFNTLIVENTKAVVFAVNHVYNTGLANGIIPDSDETSSILLRAAASFWSKIYDREFFLENAKFLHMWYEDIPVINPMLSYLDKISLVRKRLYYYVRERDDSITNSSLDMRQLDYSQAERTAIEATNPVFRKYQLVRSISRVLNDKNAAFYDHRIEFIRSYKEEILSPEVIELFSENVREELKKILDEGYKEVIPNIIYLNGFTCKNRKNRDTIESYYKANAFWNDAEVVWLDESNCDLASDDKTKALFDNGKYNDLVFLLSLRKIYETGGVFLSNNINFSSTLNSTKFNEAFFGFIDNENITKDIFGGSAGNEVFRMILDMFNSVEALTVFECVMSVLVGVCGVKLTGELQSTSFGACIYPANTFVFKTDASNICSILNMGEDKKHVTMSLSVYSSMIKYFNFSQRKSNIEITQALRRVSKLTQRVEKRDDKITKLQNRVEKRDKKIEKLEARVEKRDKKIAKLEKQVDKLNKKNSKLEAKNKKNEKRLALYNNMSKSFVFKIYRKLFKVFHK